MELKLKQSNQVENYCLSPTSSSIMWLKWRWRSSGRFLPSNIFTEVVIDALEQVFLQEHQFFWLFTCSNKLTSVHNQHTKKWGRRRRLEWNDGFNMGSKLYLYVLRKRKHGKHTNRSLMGRNFLITGKSPEFIIIGYLLWDINENTWKFKRQK